MAKKIIELFNLTSQADRDVGIEIEMEGHNLHIHCPGWIETEDGSLRGESAEYVLRRPIKAKEVPLYLTRLQKHLKENGAVLAPSDRCGVHIHINCQQMTEEEVFKFAILYMVVEDLLVKWCGPTREGNLFCLRAKDAEALVYYLTEAIQKNKISHLVYKDIRYAALNFTSLSKYGSLEFRTMQTPEDFKTIETWVEMLMSIKNASQQYGEPHHIIEDISLKGTKQFLRSVFKEHAEQLFCNNMQELLIAAARRIQDAAYAQRLKKKVNPDQPNNQQEELPGWLKDKIEYLKVWVAVHNHIAAFWDVRNETLWWRIANGNVRTADYYAERDWHIDEVPDWYYENETFEELKRDFEE